LRKYCRLNKEKIDHSTSEKVGAPKSDLKESDVKIVVFECVIQIKQFRLKRLSKLMKIKLKSTSKRQQYNSVMCCNFKQF